MFALYSPISGSPHPLNHIHRGYGVFSIRQQSGVKWSDRVASASSPSTWRTLRHHKNSLHNKTAIPSRELCRTHSYAPSNMIMYMRLWQSTGNWLDCGPQSEAHAVPQITIGACSWLAANTEASGKCLQYYLDHESFEPIVGVVSQGDIKHLKVGVFAIYSWIWVMIW